MSENLQTGSSEALSIEKLPVHISADKDRKRFSGARGKGIQTSKCTQLFMKLRILVCHMHCCSSCSRPQGLKTDILAIFRGKNCESNT